MGHMVYHQATILSLDFLLISCVPHFDSVYFYVLCNKQTSFFFILFFFNAERPIFSFIHTSPSNAQQTLKQTAEPSSQRTSTQGHDDEHDRKSEHVATC